MALFLNDSEILKLTLDGANIESLALDGQVVARKPRITTHPNGGTINEEQAKELTVVADSLGSTLSYQWYQNDVAVSGATSSIYTFTPSATGTFSFYCLVSGFGGNSESNTISIVVEAAMTTHQWTIGSHLGTFVNLYGFADDTPSGGTLLGQFQPREVYGGPDCVALFVNEISDSNYICLFDLDGNHHGAVTLDIAGYGEIKGTLAYDPVYDPETTSVMTIWQKTTTGGSGSANGDGFYAFTKARAGQTIDVKIKFEPT